ncbi:hypothetical protein EUGRSUZ_L01744 [Eucalyptus grandis]|uniref:Uncharacterized protein n=1 Tax=Eucalyptus grandis TaxID=71139 RepID=A0A058ZSC2_EUCGR|nr:hypothetical protein EUGRSUZ_L01744 [Eucalyptus grandis]
MDAALQRQCIQRTKSTYSMGSRLKGFSDWLLMVIASGNLEAIVHSASRENLPLIEELWKDEAIQATYNRRNELEKLPRVATYFLKRVRSHILISFLINLQFLALNKILFLSLYLS